MLVYGKITDIGATYVHQAGLYRPAQYGMVYRFCYHLREKG
jgi:hypothetical protein